MPAVAHVPALGPCVAAELAAASRAAADAYFRRLLTVDAPRPAAWQVAGGGGAWDAALAAGATDGAPLPLPPPQDTDALAFAGALPPRLLTGLEPRPLDPQPGAEWRARAHAVDVALGDTAGGQAELGERAAVLVAELARRGWVVCWRGGGGAGAVAPVARPPPCRQNVCRARPRPPPPERPQPQAVVRVGTGV